jgi:Flp pilus assembly pilin Flp
VTNRLEMNVFKSFKAFIDDESAIAAVEYAVIGSFMGLALIPVLPGVKEAIESRLSQLAEAFF